MPRTNNNNQKQLQNQPSSNLKHLLLTAITSPQHISIYFDLLKPNTTRSTTPQISQHQPNLFRAIITNNYSPQHRAILAVRLQQVNGGRCREEDKIFETEINFETVIIEVREWGKNLRDMIVRERVKEKRGHREE